ncbi:MAG: DUF1566 domain-containing protein [Pseudomonadota bacterium]
MKIKKLICFFVCFKMLFFAADAPAYPIPDTGQTTCYDFWGHMMTTCPSLGQDLYGQDANYTINPMSYTKLDDRGKELPDSVSSWVTVRDNVTGLIWENKTDDGTIHDKDKTFTWYDSNPATNNGYPGTQGNGTDTEDFIKALNDAKYGGYNDWRMPTAKELGTIVNYSLSSPEPKVNPGYFSYTQASFYWSSTILVYDTSNAWGVNFNYGYDVPNYKSSSNYVRAVRGGSSGNASTAPGVYKEYVYGTIADTSTGLIWQQASSPDPMTWEQALAYCGRLNISGDADWRLPTIKELRSLVDFSHDHPSIDTNYFPNTFSSFYWSSTTYAYDSYTAWGIDFSFGTDDFKDKYTGYHYVRAVRGGQSVAPIPPAPDLKANGQDVQITVSSGTPVSITASLAPGNEIGKPADWWIAYSSPDGWYSLDSKGWTPGINMLAQHPLFRVSPVVIYSSTLPVGDYSFYFLVDMSPNGIIVSPLYYDVVQVHVKSMLSD